MENLNKTDKGSENAEKEPLYSICSFLTNYTSLNITKYKQNKTKISRHQPFNQPCEVIFIFKVLCKKLIIQR